jgi:hypothetical protein
VNSRFFGSDVGYHAVNRRPNPAENARGDFAAKMIRLMQSLANGLNLTDRNRLRAML